MKVQIGRYCSNNSVKWLVSFNATSPQDDSLWSWAENRAAALVMEFEDGCKLLGYTNYPVSTFLIAVDEVFK